jgi:hypothetical protein
VSRWLNDLNKASWNRVPIVAAFLFVIFAGLAITWTVGYLTPSIGDKIGEAFHFQYTSEEITFFALGSLGTLAFWGLRRWIGPFEGER